MYYVLCIVEQKRSTRIAQHIIPIACNMLLIVWILSVARTVIINFACIIIYFPMICICSACCVTQCIIHVSIIFIYLTKKHIFCFICKYEHIGKKTLFTQWSLYCICVTYIIACPASFIILCFLSVWSTYALIFIKENEYAHVKFSKICTTLYVTQKKLQNEYNADYI